MKPKLKIENYRRIMTKDYFGQIFSRKPHSHFYENKEKGVKNLVDNFTGN